MAVVENDGSGSQRVLKACVIVMVGLVVLKFVALLAEFAWDPSKAPWFLLLAVVVPAAAIWVLLNRRPRIGAGLMGVLLLLFAATVVAALLRDGFARQSWADYPFAYGGLVIAVVGLAAAASLMRTPGPRR